MGSDIRYTDTQHRYTDTTTGRGYVSIRNRCVVSYRKRSKYHLMVESGALFLLARLRISVVLHDSGSVQRIQRKIWMLIIIGRANLAGPNNTTAREVFLYLCKHQQPLQRSTSFHESGHPSGKIARSFLLKTSRSAALQKPSVTRRYSVGRSRSFLPFLLTPHYLTSQLALSVTKKKVNTWLQSAGYSTSGVTCGTTVQCGWRYGESHVPRPRVRQM